MDRSIPGSIPGPRSGIGMELNRIMKWFSKPGILLLVFLLWSAPAQAQQAPRLDEPVQPHPAGNAAIDRLKSPFCPGMMLEVCPSPQAKLLRDSIQELAWSGMSADSLVEWMLSNHGEVYRAVPRAAGSGLWAWVMPPLALLGGFIIVALALQHFRTRREEVPAASGGLSPEDESALADALKELKDSEEVVF